MISTVSSVIERFGRAGFEPVRCSFLAFVEKEQGSRTGEYILGVLPPGYRLGFA